MSFLSEKKSLWKHSTESLEDWTTVSETQTNEIIWGLAAL